MISLVDTAGPSNLFSAPLDGLRRNGRDAAAAAQKIAAGELSPENVVDLIQATALVKANAVALRTSDELAGCLLDTRA